MPTVDNRRKRGAQVIVAMLASLMFVFLSAAPAQAGSAMLSNDGVQGTISYTFGTKQIISLTFRLTDTACNSSPATGYVYVYGTNNNGYESVRWANEAGCNTTRSYSTGAFSVGFNILNIKMCVRGLNRDPEVCSSYHDNPYT